MANGIEPLPPVQHKDYDITAERELARPANSPPLSKANADVRNPATMMREMGFDPNTSMTPLQFLVAVYNDDVEKIYNNEVKRKRIEMKGGIGMSYRIEAAKTASKYIHMEMPKVVLGDETGNFGESLMKAARAGDGRLRTKTMIIETVERISPDVPLPEASYPPIYGQIKPVVVDEVGMVEGEVLPPEGDKDYNPDAD